MRRGEKVDLLKLQKDAGQIGEEMGGSMSAGDVTDIAYFEERLADDSITFDFARGLLDDLEAASSEVADLRRQLEERGDDGGIREPEEFAIASELQAVRGELSTARDALRGIWPFIEEDDGGFATPEYQKAINDVRAALAMTEDANP